MSRFAVLMYHRIESEHCLVTDPAERPWAVSKASFGLQLERLRALGFVGVSMDQVHRRLEAGHSLPPAWVAITFDDGNESDYVHALPMLAHHGFRATFFVCGVRVDTPGGLSRAMIRELHAAGMHIGSHAMTHRFFTSLTADEETDELRVSRELLEAVVGSPVDHFAPPGGRWSRRTRAALRDLSYRAVSTSRFGLNAATRASFAYRRLPVVAATSHAHFDAMVHGRRLHLWPGYLRAGARDASRAIIGDRAYSRVRAGAEQRP